MTSSNFYEMRTFGSRGKTFDWIAAIAILCMITAPAYGQSLGAAEGTLTVNGEVVELQYSYAITQPGTFDESTEDTLIFMTNIELEPNMLTEGGLLQQLEGSGELKAVELTLDFEFQPISIRVRHQEFGGGPSSSIGSQKFELGDVEETQIAGRFYTTETEDFFGTSYEYDVSFDAEIYRKTPAGAPSAEDMEMAAASPHAAIYSALTDAVMAGDVDAMKPLVIADILTELDGDNAAQVIGFFQTVMPKQVEFLRVTINGETSTLEMRSTGTDVIQSGTAEFMVEEGEWKIGLSQWEG